jgi:hypothetical protein
MHVELQQSGRRLVVRFDQAAALDATLEKARAESLVLRLEARLEEGAAVVLELQDAARRLELPARIKQVFRSGVDRFGTLLAVDVASRREIQAGEEAELLAEDPAPLPVVAPAMPSLRTPSAAALEAAGFGRPPAADQLFSDGEPSESEPASEDEFGPEVDAAALVELEASLDSDAAEDSDAEAGEGAAFSGETLGASVAFDLQRMRPDEKVRLAAKANRLQRQILLRDRTPQVLLALLNNPHVENAEVLEIAKNPKVVGPVLQRLADDRRFGSNAQVQSALARNPSTPWTVTTRLLPLLHTRELRELARSQHVREAVRKAALKIYLGRM